MLTGMPIRSAKCPAVCRCPPVCWIPLVGAVAALASWFSIPGSAAAPWHTPTYVLAWRLACAVCHRLARIVFIDLSASCGAHLVLRRHLGGSTARWVAPRTGFGFGCLNSAHRWFVPLCGEAWARRHYIESVGLRVVRDVRTVKYRSVMVCFARVCRSTRTSGHWHSIHDKALPAIFLPLTRQGVTSAYGMRSIAGTRPRGGTHACGC